MPKIGDAPNGEKTSLDGTEKLPISGSQFSLVSSIKNYVKTITDTLYSSFNHTHTDSDNGGVVNHTVLTNAGTSLHVPTYSSDSTTYLNGMGEWTAPPAFGSVYDSDILFTDNTVNNSSSDAHGFLPKLAGNTTNFLRADGTWATPSGTGTVYDSDVVMQAITTNNADSDYHGFLPSLSGDSNDYLNGKSEWISLPRLLAIVSYNPNTETTVSTTSTTGADIDATNLTVTFTAPASGKVLVRLNACAYHSTSGQYYMWVLRTTGGANIAGTKRDVAGATVINRLSVTIYITGLTPGTSTTYRWGHLVGSSTGNIRYGDDGTTVSQAGAAVMEVWSV